jgi:hypothetical protein
MRAKKGGVYELGKLRSGGGAILTLLICGGMREEKTNSKHLPLLFLCPGRQWGR